MRIALHFHSLEGKQFNMEQIEVNGLIGFTCLKTINKKKEEYSIEIRSTLSILCSSMDKIARNMLSDSLHAMHN